MKVAGEMASSAAGGVATAVGDCRAVSPAPSLTRLWAMTTASIQPRSVVARRPEPLRAQAKTRAHRRGT